MDHAQDRFLRRVFEDSPIGMALVALDERILEANTALCRMLRYSRDELLKKTVPDITHPSDMVVEFERKDELAAGRRPSFVVEKRYIRSDGSQFLGRCSVTAITDEQGNITHYVGQLENLGSDEHDIDPLQSTWLDSDTELRIGRFALLDKLGSGGMGVVYGGRDLESGRRVAVKVLAAEHLDAQGLARFRREAELLATLEHPAIVAHVEHGETSSGEPYLAMEWLEGESLRDRLERGSLPWREVVAIGRRVSSALEAAHQRGVIHRDIKPSNMFIVDGDVEQTKLLDFGVARLMTATATKLTITGNMVGTPHYMSPEQIRAQELDARSDLFSLGCVLHECLDGQPPFHAAHTFAILTQIMFDEPAPLAEEAAPEPLRRLLGQLLAKSPAQRVPTAGVLVERLDALGSMAFA